MMSSTLKTLFFITSIYSFNGVQSLFLSPVLDKIIVKYKTEICNITELAVSNMGSSDFSINITSHFSKFPDNTIVTLTLFRKSEEKYVLFGRKIEHKICDFIKNDKLFYPDILLHSNFPKSCPIETKEYKIRNYKMNFQNLASVMPVGSYKITADITSGKELQTAITLLIRAVQQNLQGFGLKKKNDAKETSNADVLLETI